MMQIMQVMKLLSFYGKSTETLDSMEKVTRPLYNSLLISLHCRIRNTDQNLCRIQKTYPTKKKIPKRREGKFGSTSHRFGKELVVVWLFSTKMIICRQSSPESLEDNSISVTTSSLIGSSRCQTILAFNFILFPPVL